MAKKLFLTDSAKLTLLLEQCHTRGSIRLNWEGGYAYDRVVRKAIADGYFKIQRYEYAWYRTYTDAKITAKGVKKLKALEKKKNYQPIVNPWYMNTKEQFAHRASKIGRK